MIKKIREEKYFKNLEELKLKMVEDEKIAQEYISKYDEQKQKS
jgi:FAD synthase